MKRFAYYNNTVFIKNDFVSQLNQFIKMIVHKLFIAAAFPLIDYTVAFCLSHNKWCRKQWHFLKDCDISLSFWRHQALHFVLQCISGQAGSSFESRVVVVCEKMMNRACWAKSKHLIHSKTFRGMTLLHLAAGQGYATLIQTLIKWRSVKAIRALRCVYIYV